MIKKYKLSVLATVLFISTNAQAYKIQSGDSYVSASMGANVNVARFDKEGQETPRGQLPITGTYTYAIDRNFGMFGSITPQFSSGSVGLGAGFGLTYWFSYLDAPYVPYISAAFTPAILWPVGPAVSHVNLGITPSVGMNYFVLADFLVGAHVNFSPSYAFVGEDRKFELAVSAMLDVTFKL